MKDMLTPHVTELVRQGHVVTHPLRLREPLTLRPAVRRPQVAPLLHHGG
jgi:hypothetical protein